MRSASRHLSHRSGHDSVGHLLTIIVSISNNHHEERLICHWNAILTRTVRLVRARNEKTTRAGRVGLALGSEVSKQFRTPWTVIKGSRTSRPRPAESACASDPTAAVSAHVMEMRVGSNNSLHSLSQVRSVQSIQGDLIGCCTGNGIEGAMGCSS